MLLGCVSQEDLKNLYVNPECLGYFTDTMNQIHSLLMFVSCYGVSFSVPQTLSHLIHFCQGSALQRASLGCPGDDWLEKFCCFTGMSLGK